MLNGLRSLCSLQLMNHLLVSLLGSNRFNTSVVNPVCSFSFLQSLPSVAMKILTLNAPHRCFLLRSMGNNPDDTCYLLNTKFRFTGCDLCFLFNKNTIYEPCWFSPVDFQFRLIIIRQANQITLDVNFISPFLTEFIAVCVILSLSKGVFVFYGVNVNGAVVLLVLVMVGGVVWILYSVYPVTPRKLTCTLFFIE